MLFIILGRGRV